MEKRNLLWGPDRHFLLFSRSPPRTQDSWVSELSPHPLFPRKEGVMSISNLQRVSQKHRQQPGLTLASEVGGWLQGCLTGLKPERVESDAVSRQIVSELSQIVARQCHREFSWCHREL